MFDAISITPGDQRASWTDINPILILAFVEGVLGYHPVKESTGEYQWYFKRDVAFRE